MNSTIDAEALIKALQEYRDRLKAKGEPVKVAVANRCIAIVKRLLT